jgi:hypothetical protein
MAARNVETEYENDICSMRLPQDCVPPLPMGGNLLTG